MRKKTYEYNCCSLEPVPNELINGVAICDSKKLNMLDILPEYRIEVILILQANRTGAAPL